MNNLILSLLFLFITAVTNTSFAAQGDDEEQPEPECDHITRVDAF